MMQIAPTPIQLKSLPTRGIFNNPTKWLEEKTAFDTELHQQPPSDVWVVDNKEYNLSGFLERHPGGRHWLERTRGQDVTELFYTHHLNEQKAKATLNKFYVRDSPKPFTRFTFQPTGYYETLKRKLLAKYSAAELQDQTHSQLLTLKIVGLFLSVFLLTCYTQSYLLAALSGFLLVAVVGEGHNFMHQRQNPYRYVFALTGFTHQDWEGFHAISHHMHPNTQLDYEIGVFEPLAYFLQNQKPNPFFIELLMQPFFFVMVPLNLVIKLVFSLVSPKRFTLSLLYPFAEVVVLYLFNGDLWASFKLFFFMQACFGFSLTKCIFCGHRTQQMWTAGCEPIEDFGEHTLASTCDTTTELKGFLSMALFAGFNQHIAHHLFPTVDHYHLSKVTPLVKETCSEFGLPYHCKSKWECMVSISKNFVQRVPYAGSAKRQ